MGEGEDLSWFVTNMAEVVHNINILERGLLLLGLHGRRIDDELRVLAAKKPFADIFQVDVRQLFHMEVKHYFLVEGRQFFHVEVRQYFHVEVRQYFYLEVRRKYLLQKNPKIGINH